MYIMLQFVLPFFFLLFFIPTHHALLLLESAEWSLNFARQAPREAYGVVTHSEVGALLDWQAVNGAYGLQFRVAFLLQPRNAPFFESLEVFLAAIIDVRAHCKSIPVFFKDVDAATSVSLLTHEGTICVLYACGDDAPGSLHLLLLHWHGGNVSVAVDEPLLSLGVAKSWLLSHNSDVADAQLLYVQTTDGATSAILLENEYSAGVHSPVLTTLRLPQKVTAEDTELVSSCFLPGVGVSGLVRRSRMEGTFYFEVYHIFPAKQDAALLLETSTAVINDMSLEEQHHCSLSSRVSFTGCRLTLTATQTLRVGITLMAKLESPTASSVFQEFGGWVECGRTVFEGSAVIKYSGQRALVSPLRRVQFQPTALGEAADALGEHVKGRLGRCVFYNGSYFLDCSNSSASGPTRARFFSRSCIAAYAWWRKSWWVDLYLCDWLGMDFWCLFSFIFTFFTATFCVQFVTRLLLVQYI